MTFYDPRQKSLRSCACSLKWLIAQETWVDQGESFVQRKLERRLKKSYNKVFKSFLNFSPFFGAINVSRDKTLRVNDEDDEQLCELKLRVSRVKWKSLRLPKENFREHIFHCQFVSACEILVFCVCLRFKWYQNGHHMCDIVWENWKIDLKLFFSHIFFCK